MLKLQIVKCLDGMFIKGLSYPYTENSLINGKSAVPSYIREWRYISGETEVKEITSLKNRQVIDSNYFLKDESLSNDKIPLRLTREDVGYSIDCDCDVYWKKHQQLRSLYKEEHVYEEEKYIDVAFEIVSVDEYDVTSPNSPKDMRISQKTSHINAKEQLTHEKRLIDVTSYRQLDKLLVAPPLLHLRPCYLASYNAYNIIRGYVKYHIDTRVAKITSDYDFCLKVEKIVSIKPFISKHEITKQSGGSYAKPKYRETCVKDKKVVLIYLTHKNKGYQGADIVPDFLGDNLEDLFANVKQYLENLIANINAPLAECEHCKGVGNVLDNSVLDNSVLN